MRWKLVALVLAAGLTLLWGGRQLTDAAGVEGGFLLALRQVSMSALLGREMDAPVHVVRNLATSAPGAISLSIGPIVPALGVFASQPVKGAHTFGLGIQPVVELRDGQGVLRTEDSTTSVTVRIKPDTGTVGASLSCGARGLSQRVTNGVARWGDPDVAGDDCTIDLRGAEYVLEAIIEGIVVGATAPFPVVWAGDADGDCLVDIVDFSVLVRSFGKALGDAGYDERADLNGDHDVKIQDFSVLATLFGTRCPSLVVSPDVGGANAEVTVTGSAYTAYREMSFSFDGTSLEPVGGPVLAGGDGSFSAGFTVPAAIPPGTYAVKASQAGGRVVAAAILTVAP